MPYFTTPDGVQLHYKDWGQGRPVLLLHGWLQSADSWDEVAMALADNGFRTLSVDRRGHGRSEQPWTGYDYSTLSDDLAALMTQKDLQQAVLVGQGMGAGEVLRYLSRHDSLSAVPRVQQVVLVAGAVPCLLQGDGQPWGFRLAEWEQMRDQLRLNRLGFVEQYLRTVHAGRWRQRSTLESLLHWSLLQALQTSPRAALETLDTWVATDLRADLLRLQQPVLLIHGSADRTVPLAWTAGAVLAQLPQARLRRYEGAAHGLLVSHRNRVVADLLQFLRYGF